jgi:hypothetical protein
MKPAKLLTRDEFREGVFARDGYKCVMCKSSGKLDAHHIIERRLYTAPDEFGGYFMENGVSVCEPCHLKCEQTVITVEELREACNIQRVVLPEHLYEDQRYDKWGNVILPNGQRMRGDLFYDESVQKVLGQAGVLDLFTNRVKYNRTYHVPWSPGMHDDDRMMPLPLPFVGKRVIVSTKWDGENTTIYPDYLHARSIDGRGHPSRAWVKNFTSTFQHHIPEDWRICGENLYAEHSIRYEALPSYFLGFSVWNERNVCLSWDDTLDVFSILGVTPVDVLYDGIYDETAIKALYDEKTDWATKEGYVVRLAESFPYGAFRQSVGKFVRKGHVMHAKHHWQSQAVIPNGIV